MQKQNQAEGVEPKSPDFSLDGSSVKSDAAMKDDPLHESPVLCNLSNFESIGKFIKDYRHKYCRKKKKTKTEHNVSKNNVDGSGIPENSFSSKNLTPALDVPSEHTIQCASTSVIISEYCVKADICLGENEGKEQSMLTKAAEKSNGECDDIQDEDCNSIGANAELFSLDRTIVSNPKNKLLILDVNGLLADCFSNVHRRYQLPEPDFWLSRSNRVYKRPFCDDFLQFCLDRFHVGVWSSKSQQNVDKLIKFLMGGSASKLLFCWSQAQCTLTTFTTVENKQKPLVLKELIKLWEKMDPNLPWKKGEFNESNTLLLDDSPYKALVNPLHTAVFPYSYRYHHNEDSSLGPGGDLRVYLEGLAMAENVQEYVSLNPFGQRPIREANPSWGYYCKVIEEVKAQREKMVDPHH